MDSWSPVWKKKLAKILKFRVPMFLFDAISSIVEQTGISEFRIFRKFQKFRKFRTFRTKSAESKHHMF